MNSLEPIFGVLAFFSFACSVVAAVLAIDMYALLRTGESGSTWRVLIIAAVMFALTQALRMATFFDWAALERYGLSQIAELMFALSMMYAFFLQRRAFTSQSKLREKETEVEPSPLEELMPGAEEAELIEEPLHTEVARESWPRLDTK